MIQAHLPKSMSLTSAPKAEMLSAVCKAVAGHRKETNAIVRTAVSAHKEWAGDILKTALNCLRLNRDHPDCQLARSVLDGAIAADSEDAASLTEIFVGLIPGCANAESQEGGAASNAENINSAPGSVSGGGASGAGNQCVVCHNNHEIQIPCNQLSKYLARHPGDHAGPCQPTPTTNP
jgi:hypothetical protein